MNISVVTKSNMPGFSGRGKKIEASKAELQGYLNESKKVKEIAEIFDSSPSWVSVATAKRGLENKRSRRTKALEEMQRLVKSGADLKRIMKETGLSRRVVAYSIHRHLESLKNIKGKI